MAIDEQSVYVEFRNVSMKYKSDNTIALNDVSFSIKKGEIFGYIGPNGAGKSTSIKILVGLIDDFVGDVYINGINIRKNRAAVQKYIGYLPQDVGFQEWRSVEHILRTFGLLSGLDKTELPKRIDEVLKLVDLFEVKSKKIVYLSGGMKQKLLLAQALLHKPQILILDEPMSGLDPASRYQIKQIIKKLAQENIIILFSSHILSDVQNIADKIGLLSNGNLLKMGSSSDLEDEFNVDQCISLEFASDVSLCKGLDEISQISSYELKSQQKIFLHFPHDIDIDSKIKEILNCILQQNCKLRSMNLVKPSLEDVYLNYIGGERS